MQSLPTRICTDAIPHDSATQQTRSRLHATNWRQPRISGCGWRCCGKKSKGSSQRRKNSSESCFGDVQGRQGEAGCSSQAGERMQTSNEPPTCICTLASETVKVSGLNQRFTWSAELQALNNVSRRAWKTRETLRRGGCRTAASFFASTTITIISFGFQGFQVLAQPVEALLPLDPPGVDPLLGLAERLGLDGADANAADLLRTH